MDVDSCVEGRKKGRGRYYILDIIGRYSYHDGDDDDDDNILID